MTRQIIAASVLFHVKQINALRNTVFAKPIGWINAELS